MTQRKYSFITPDEAKRIIALRSQGHSYRAIARMVGRKSSVCQSVVTRSGAATKPRLTAAQRAEILRIYRKHPVTQQQLARQFGVTRTTIYRVLLDAYKTTQAALERGA